MSKSAADSFLTAIEKTRKEFADEESVYYKKFIEKGETPTKKDIETFDKLIKEYEGIANYYRTKVVNNIKGLQTFGGPQDTVFSGAHTLLKTMARNSK